MASYDLNLRKSSSMSPSLHWNIYNNFFFYYFIYLYDSWLGHKHHKNKKPNIKHYTVFYNISRYLIRYPTLVHSEQNCSPSKLSSPLNKITVKVGRRVAIQCANHTWRPWNHAGWTPCRKPFSRQHEIHTRHHSWHTNLTLISSSGLRIWFQRHQNVGASRVIWCGRGKCLAKCQLYFCTRVILLHFLFYLVSFHLGPVWRKARRHLTAFPLAHVMMNWMSVNPCSAGQFSII